MTNKKIEFEEIVIEQEELIKIIRTEMDWCRKSQAKATKSVDYVKGFLDGLQQAIFIVKKFK